MLEEAARIPGVIAVGYVSETPLGTGPSSSRVFRQGTTDFRMSTSVFGAKYFSISPGYLHAAGTHLLTGRDFSWHDDEHVPKMALVNRTFARRLFGDTPAVGQHFMMFDKNSYEIVGVTEDGKYDSLTESPWPAMFFPAAQSPDSNTTLVVRSELPTSEIAPVLSHKLADIDPSLPFTIHSWPQALAFVLFPARVATASLGVMGALAAMLAITGIFGMATYSVSKRIKELGIRIALGAKPLQLMRSALGRPVVILLCGSAAGLLLGVVASRLLAQIVYEATPRDPLVLGGVVATMAFLGLLATLIPAQHALKVDPAGLLREE
jgi:ABC-type antimicrobial peptide transport system permease subunit